METPSGTGDSPPRKRKRSTPTTDEYLAAESLLLLANSGGGFCSAIPSLPADSAEKTHQEVSPKRDELRATHACLDCGRVFPTHQALGGHMTSHRSATARRNPAAASGGIHECRVCHKQFLKGQALGGHLRLHYKKDDGVVAGDRSGGSSGSSSAISYDRPHFNFDLNLLPPPE